MAVGRGCDSAATQSEEDMDFRRGPWTVEEDLILVNYIANHGEGRWNSLARCAGLKRTGKSCRLRWLNYLRPDVRRGNITPEEQLLILELHSRWGNRWSKIAQHLPGRTDNEIKNYWRTRVQKHAKQLQCDVNSKQFKDVMRYLWMPRLIERIRAANSTSSANDTAVNTTTYVPPPPTIPAMSNNNDSSDLYVHVNPSPESSSVAAASSSTTTTTAESLGAQQFTSAAELQSCCMQGGNVIQGGDAGWPETLLSPGGYSHHVWPEFELGSDVYESLWNVDDAEWFLKQ